MASAIGRQARGITSGTVPVLVMGRVSMINARSGSMGDMRSLTAPHGGKRTRRGGIARGQGIATRVWSFEGTWLTDFDGPFIEWEKIAHVAPRRCAEAPARCSFAA